MAGWRPPDSTPLEELRQARAALAGAHEFLEAEEGNPGRVDLTVLTGGNSLALQLLHDALGYRTTDVEKRSARSAIATASHVLEQVSKGRDPTVEKALFRSISRSTKPHPSRVGSAMVDAARIQESSATRLAASGVDTESNQGSPAVPPRPSEGISARPSETSSTHVRRLTSAGIERAREFLSFMREHPRANRQPPRELLFGDRYSRAFREPVPVERRPFRTRREAAEYFAPKFESIRHLVADHAELWSWLGMYYFADTVRVAGDEVRLSREDETYVVDPKEGRSRQRRFRHYLWSSWRLYEAHGNSVGFLLDQDLTSIGQLALRALDTVRIFNSAGVIQLALRLYTQDGQQKRGFIYRPGGLQHLTRVLDQLERTYDVYGMSPDALIKVLPEEFQRWDRRVAPRVLDATTMPKSVRSVAETSPDNTIPVEPVRRESVEHQAVEAPSDKLKPKGHESETEAEPQPAPYSVRQTLLDVRAQIDLQGQVSWADPRDHLEEGSEAWKVFVAVCGVPERRLFRTAFIYRLDEVLASLD